MLFEGLGEAHGESRISISILEGLFLSFFPASQPLLIRGKAIFVLEVKGKARLQNRYRKPCTLLLSLYLKNAVVAVEVLHLI